jgi:hypothetical protein
LEETAGRFNFDQLPAGEYELTVSHGREQVAAKRKLKLNEGEVQVENVVISDNGIAN